MTDTLSTRIGKRVRHRRESLGLTREQLAEQSELSVQFLADIETGRKSMTTNSFYKIAQALNISCDFILFGEERTAKTTRLESMLARLSQRDRELAESILENFVQAVTRK